MALLVPIDWPEPFGLVMIEAMACGTPVIAFNRGSVPEVIEDGLTGFIVEDEARRDRGGRSPVAPVAARRSASASSSASPRAGWRRTISRSIALDRSAAPRSARWSFRRRRLRRSALADSRSKTRARSRSANRVPSPEPRAGGLAAVSGSVSPRRPRRLGRVSGISGQAGASRRRRCRRARRRRPGCRNGRSRSRRASC